MPFLSKGFQQQLTLNLFFSTAINMDLFSYTEDHRTWICVPCGTGVKPKQYGTHLRRYHADHPKIASSKKERELVVEELMLKSPIDPDSPSFQLPPAGLLALPHLPIYDGLSCPKCSYICCTRNTMEYHHRRQHVEFKRPRGRQPITAAAAAAPRWEHVSCQRLFLVGSKSQFFAVISPVEVRQGEEAQRREELAARLPEAEYIRAQVDEALEQGNQEKTALENVILDNAAPTEVSAWLEMTRWPKYLQGHSFATITYPTSKPR